LWLLMNKGIAWRTSAQKRRHGSSR